MPKKNDAIIPLKKERLTLTQLASYDDILTDALVDHVYFWTTIRKNRSKYNLTRGISEDDVTKILLHQLVVDRDAQKAEALLLQLPGLRKFHGALKTPREKEDFQRHMRKYINIWLPDCPFEVSTTNRYTIVTHEAAVTARRNLKKGEAVKYLVGNLVAMTSEEEKDLDLTRRDFSIVMSSRKKTPSLFLGPARFANHDCNANARLITRGSEGMQVVAARDIGVGEEITVTYGDNYFGEANCECLCLSCENTGRGAWLGSTRGSSSASPSEVEDDDSQGQHMEASPRKRSRLNEPSQPLSTDGRNSNPRKKRKIGTVTKQASLAAKPYTTPEKAPLQAGRGRAWLDKEGKYSSEGSRCLTPPTYMKTRSSRSKLARGDAIIEAKVPGSLKVIDFKPPGWSSTPKSKVLEGLSKPKISWPTSSTADSIFDRLSAALKKRPSKVDSGTSSDAATISTWDSSTNTNRITVMELVPPGSGDNSYNALRGGDRPVETSTSSSDQDSLSDNSNPPVSSPATTPRPSEEPEIDSKTGVRRSLDVSDGDLSELDPDAELDDSSMTVTEKSPKRKRAPRGSRILPTIEIEDASLRVPGDYTRTPLLLGEKYSRWVDCRTCLGCWVQPNGYQTRKECPRCERHSKLYGYQWPKTEKQGRDDEEERVMDHRTVHRFIRPEEERLLVKRGKGVAHAGSESTSRTQSLGVEADKRPTSRLRGSVLGRRGSQLRSGD
ncbi:MAG: hypothetical protein Q9222_002925 [Ikaeria aurantiellina]